MNKSEKRNKMGLLILVIIVMSLFYRIIQVLNLESTTLNSRFDNLIPLIPYFVIPYLLYYFYILFIFIIYWNTDYLTFKKMVYSFIIVNVIAYIIFIFYQTNIIRYEVADIGWLTYMIRQIYDFDYSTNSFPSLHVVNSVLAYDLAKDINTDYTKYLFILTVMILLSTLLIKQHVIIDVIGGILLALGFITFKEEILNIFIIEKN